jgi:hypothetical protein
MYRVLHCNYPGAPGLASYRHGYTCIPLLYVVYLHICITIQLHLLLVYMYYISKYLYGW